MKFHFSYQNKRNSNAASYCKLCEVSCLWKNSSSPWTPQDAIPNLYNAQMDEVETKLQTVTLHLDMKKFNIRFVIY